MSDTTTLETSAPETSAPAQTAAQALLEAAAAPSPVFLIEDFRINPRSNALIGSFDLTFCELGIQLYNVGLFVKKDDKGNKIGHFVNLMAFKDSNATSNRKSGRFMRRDSKYPNAVVDDVLQAAIDAYNKAAAELRDRLESQA
jgi:hypothetical protein